MKTLCLLFVVFSLSTGVSAQTKSDTLHTNSHQQYSQNNHEIYLFKNGKLMMRKFGTISHVSQDVELANGTTISTNGKITRKNGKTQTLKEGEWVDLNGNVHYIKMKTSNNLKSKSDSSMKK